MYDIPDASLSQLTTSHIINNNDSFDKMFICSVVVR